MAKNWIFISMFFFRPPVKGFGLSPGSDTINQKWNLQKSACDDGVKIELRPVLAQFRANLSFPALKMLLSGL